MNAQLFQTCFSVNSIAPVLLTQALMDSLKRAHQAKVIMVTSFLGSLKENTDGQFYIYRASKAALNAASKALALDLEPEDITVLMINPGWVQTDLGGEGAWITTDQSVDDMQKVIETTSLENTGQFRNHDGSIIAW